MAGIAFGVNKLAGGPGDARRRSLQPQTTPDTDNTDANNPDTNKTDTNNNDTNKTDSNSDSSEEFISYVNSSKQDIKGLTNLTGYVKGNANGVINFGNLTASDPSVQP
ncbi:hypothetical protein DEO72_LG2g380 [Vigna unguiculata]|uniref:Uncharacterized protein n=1 Tax=Vigna unguiculata TaxID=3917 RepID=A0A4D6KZ20_VIGUN|nr:hypothetical protein DEO72_LG2g380 [Vigna unguiculata]